MLVHPRMTRLAAGARPWYELRAATSPDAADELLIYDEVAWYAVDAGSFVKDLAKLKAPRLLVRINSPGGSVFDGLAIYNALRRHPAAVEVRVEGLAASIASVIALAGDSVRIEPSAFMMIHNAWALVIGSATELVEMAATLEKIDGQLRAIYSKKTGRPEAEFAELMAAETWLTAAEALELGLVDAVLEDDSDANARARFDLSAFANPPAELLEPAAASPRSPAAELAETPPTSSGEEEAQAEPDLEPAALHPLNVELLRRRLALAGEEPTART